MRTRTFAALALLCLIPLAGCLTTPSSTQPVAPAITGLSVLNQVQSGVEQFQTAELAAFKAGLVDKALDIKIQTALNQEALDASALATALETAASTATVQAKIDALTADLQGDLQSSILGVKDVKTQAALSGAISLAEIALNGVMSAYTAAGK